MVVLLRGGHFAATVFKVRGHSRRLSYSARPKHVVAKRTPAWHAALQASRAWHAALPACPLQAREGRAANPGKHDADALEGFDVVAHKTFHRYVVR